MSEETQAFINAIYIDKEKELISIRSSLKICLIEEAEVDTYPRLGLPLEWATWAARAIEILSRYFVSTNFTPSHWPLVPNRL